MNETELRANIAKNLTALRKYNNMTQAELAERLSYSDKSISKWERGDGTPDVYVLTRIAEMFGVTVNQLVYENKTPPEEIAVKDNSRQRRLLVTALAAGLIWFLATLLFFFLKVFMPDVEWLWMAFIYAIPASAVIIVVFAHLWWGHLARGAAVSALAWGITVCVHLTALVPNLQNMTLIYAATSVFQVLVVLWYFYRRTVLKQRQKKDSQDVNFSENTTDEQNQNESALAESAGADDE